MTAVEKMGWIGTSQYCGTAVSYMGRPVVPPRKEELIKAKADVAVLGVPFEQCCSGTPGASYGPRNIRLAWASLPYNVEMNVDINEHLAIVDCGDVPMAPGGDGSVGINHSRIEEAISEILEANVTPLTLGGDHSITIPAFRAFHKYANGKIGLIYLDSHMDALDSAGGLKITNGTVMARLAELGKLDGRNVAMIGIRMTDRECRRLCERIGVRTFYARDVFRRGIEAVTKEAVQVVKDGTNSVYCTLDIDVLDAAYSSTSDPQPGGLTSRELMEAMAIIGEAGVNALDVVEVSGPQQDWNNITARCADTAIHYFLASAAKSGALKTHPGKLSD